jgi:hypothetical protein
VATVYNGVERWAAREAAPGVREFGEKIGDRATLFLAAHTHTGSAEITVTQARGDRGDVYVNLDDPAAISIEYGREPTAEHGGMDGLYVLHRAIGMNGG